MSVAVSPDRALARVLADCALASGSGIVTAVRGKLKRIFCLLDGRVCFAASNLIEEQITETLLSQSLITPGDMADATISARGRKVSLIRYLMDEGIVERKALEKALEGHVRHLLFQTLDWSDGEARFDRGTPNLDGEVLVRLSCPSLVFDYARYHPATLDEVGARIGPPGSRPTVDEQRLGLLDSGELPAAAVHILRHCDGERTLAAVVEGSPETEEDTWRALYALTLLGVTRSATARKQVVEDDSVTREEMLARLQKAEGLEHYGVLELGASSTASQIREAYYFLARRYHPDRFRSGPLQDLREQIEAYFTKVTEAYNTLNDPRRRAEYDQQREEGLGLGRDRPEQDPASLAKQNFRRAKSLIGRGRFNEAVKYLRNAIQLDARQATYHLALGRLLSQNPRMRAEAETCLLKANRLDPTLADGYLALGQLYLKVDREEEAIRLFEETLRWEPEHVEARAELEALGRKK